MKTTKPKHITREDLDREYQLMLENGKQLRKMAEEFKKMQKEHGSLANNIADTVEDAVFYKLERTKTLGDVKFDEVLRNVKDFYGKEYGVMMKNGKSTAVVEVKHKVHENDIVDMLEKTIPNFRKGFPQTEGKQLYGAIAGMSFPPDFIRKAEEAGLFVLTQNGKNIKLGNSRGFKPKAF
jgi:hypothetical protein